MRAKSALESKNIAMINRKQFYDKVRPLFGDKLLDTQVAGMAVILDGWEASVYVDKDRRWLAYMLATTYHETAKTMRPIEEYGKGKGRPYGKRLKLDGKPYATTQNLFYGRGFVQLTWYENYQKAGNKLGIDLIAHPELALRMDIATRILFAGMFEGWFTGKKLADYFSGDKADWVNARRIINGTDKAALIAGYGRQFYAALV